MPSATRSRPACRSSRSSTVRTYQIDVTLPILGPVEVRSIRESLGLSQALFADFLGVAPTTVRSWEQGQREPSALARRFLGEIRDDPAHSHEAGEEGHAQETDQRRPGLTGD